MGTHRPGERLPNSFCDKTTIVSQPLGFWDLLAKFGERQSVGHGGQITPGQRGSRRGSYDTRIPQSCVRGHQSHGRISPSFRPLLTKQVCTHDKVQDGNSKDSTRSHPQGRLDDVSRFEGCILPNSNPSGESQVSPLHLERTIVPVPGSMFWPVHRTSSLHEDDGADFSGFTSEGSPSASLPRRLARTSCFGTGSTTINTSTSRLMLQTRSDDQLGEVSTHSHSDQDLFGDGDSLSSFEGFSNTYTCGQPPSFNQSVSEQPMPSCKGVDGSLGSPSVANISRARWKTQDEELAASAVPLLEQTVTERDHGNPLDYTHLCRPSLVVKRVQPLVGSVPPVGVSGPLPVYRRLFRRLGGISPSRFDKRKLVTIREESAHQPTGTPSDTPGTSILCGASSGQDSGHFFRQYNSTVIPCQGGRNSVVPSQLGGSGDTRLGREEFGEPSLPVRQGFLQCPGRLPQSKESSDFYGVDPTPGGVQHPLEGVGMSTSGPICHKAELQAGQFYITFPRSHGNSNGRLLVQLGSPGIIRLSTIFTGEEGTQQTQNLTRDNTYSSGPILAPEGVVPRLDSSDERHPTSLATAPRSPASTTHPSFSSGSPRASSSRMETVKRLLRHKGYSRRVAQFLAKAKRHSTIVNYQCKWKKYRQWCKQEGHTVSSPSSQKFADFLLYLHQQKNLSVSAIRGYKAMLNSVFAYKGFNLTDDPVLRDIAKACARQVPRMINRTPSWNVDVVLKALTCPPFEPLRLASIRDLTKKTIFLVALATARRVSELQALSNKVVWQDSDLILSYLPEFIAKTETVSNPTTREFRLRSLTPLVGAEDEERLLCPVRAVHLYLQRTAFTPRPRQLFLSVRDLKKPLSKAALSFFLRETIKMAHESLPEELCPLLKVRAHDIRGIATSLLLWKNKSISSILDAACWKTPSVFVDFYLKDFQRREGDVLALGPFVAAGDIML